MKLQYSLFLLFALIGMTLIGGWINFVSGGKAESLVTRHQADKNADKTLLPEPYSYAMPKSDEFVEIPEFVGLDQEGSTSDKSRPKKMPGVFRGDWGETPIYVRNDRVNYEGAAYLSLENDNQNQPPSISPAYWRMLKKIKEANAEACLSPGQGVDLRLCDFSEASSLKDANLNGADLSKARLSGELGRADLTGANLSGAAVLGSLVLSPETKLDHANLSNLQSDANNPLIAESVQLNATNFSEANLSGAKMKGANLNGARMTSVTLTGAELTATRLEGAALNQANMSFANLSAGVLTGATLTEADLTEANLSDSNFSNANLQQATLAGTELAGADFSGAILHGTNLTAAKNANRAIVDSQTDFTSAICPDGVTVDGTQVTTCVGHGF